LWLEQPIKELSAAGRCAGRALHTLGN